MMMYFDVVYNNDDEIVLNEPAEKIVQFLLLKSEVERSEFWIIRGETLKGYTAKDYLKWMRAI